jgi:anti-sigma28 factor (negative regulator of flagellin synthesis)
MRRNSGSKKAAQKNTAKKKCNKPEEGLTVSQSQQLDNTFERASTLDEKRLAAVQMIQSGYYPTPWQQLISWMIQKHEKAIGGVIAIIEYGRGSHLGSP